jgi:hypothetical protein
VALLRFKRRTKAENPAHYYSEKEGAISFNVPRRAGCKPIWWKPRADFGLDECQPGKGWAMVNIEQIAAWNPDAVLIVSYFKPVNEVVDLLKADEQWNCWTR